MTSAVMVPPEAPRIRSDNPKVFPNEYVVASFTQTSGYGLAGPGGRVCGRVPDLAEPGQCVLADQRVLVHGGRDIDIAVDAYRGKRRPPAEERVVASEGGKHAQQGGVKPQRVHGAPVFSRGQAEREWDIHQAQRGLDIEVAQAAGSALRIYFRDLEHAEIEVAAGMLGGHPGT